MRLTSWMKSAHSATLIHLEAAAFLVDECLPIDVTVGATGELRTARRPWNLPLLPFGGGRSEGAAYEAFAFVADFRSRSMQQKCSKLLSNAGETEPGPTIAFSLISEGNRGLPKSATLCHPFDRFSHGRGRRFKPCCAHSPTAAKRRRNNFR